MKYELHTALREDVESGSIWLSTPQFTSRTIVKVRSAGTGRVVHCEVKMVDRFFLKAFTERTELTLEKPSDAIFISAWYRKQLGIQSNHGRVDLEVTEAETIIGRTCACLHHPQVVVRIATILGLWSVALGIIGIALGVISFLPPKANQQPPGPTSMSVTPPTAQEPRRP